MKEYGMHDYEFSIAKATNTGRKPLRTAGELAKEFGISLQKLNGYLRREGAPKPKISNRTKCTSKSRLQWYDPDSVRKWWKQVSSNAKVSGGGAFPPSAWPTC